jgi:hypothetical protein
MSVVTPHVRQIVVMCSLLALGACSFPVAPDGDAIADELNQATGDALRSAAGPWNGMVTGGSIRLVFSLTETTGGRLQGTGTMREAGAAASVPITVSGTYNRPNLSLTFTGIVFEGRDLSGTFAEVYSSFVGISGTLRLSAENYARALPMLLQEGAPPPASLGGRLTDAITGAPVAGATVTVQGTSVSSSTTGHYGFNPNLAEGRFPVTVNHPLYAEVVRDVDIVPFKIEDFKLQPK